jgi:hypothetical protein
LANPRVKAASPTIDDHSSGGNAAIKTRSPRPPRVKDLDKPDTVGAGVRVQQTRELSWTQVTQTECSQNFQFFSISNRQQHKMDMSETSSANTGKICIW